MWNLSKIPTFFIFENTSNLALVVYFLCYIISSCVIFFFFLIVITNIYFIRIRIVIHIRYYSCI
nr:MAG TPA: hypothetical protein [Caudoviricetes sp.]